MKIKICSKCNLPINAGARMKIFRICEKCGYKPKTGERIGLQEYPYKLECPKCNGHVHVRFV